jgi:hypothetical protein
MRESRTYGSVRGALSNERPYRVRLCFAAPHESAGGTSRRFAATHQFVAIGGIADIARTGGLTGARTNSCCQQPLSEGCGDR